MKNKTKIAVEFSTILKQWLTAEEMAEVLELNETEDYTAACATHNYCDPNQAMIDAFEKIENRSIDCQSDSDCELINTAWDIARQNKFYTV